MLNEMGRWMNKPLPVIPKDIAQKVQQKNTITLTVFEQKNEILCNTTLQNEIGFGQFENGSYLVSMVCPMPGITAEMIEWWFWWHP